ncbi:hypothetical protein TREAZ_2461 [Leadbettera azotonutricia ZAS-9]|uniref:Uncharacterized protein n=1 Tax=Leadbettera azotonutricia (strain ATCC BAA-888 / DSM 13862 / ZAS-9) TaxID=545695 RepID=F5YFQ9_LEAAZ|nr:hypothetical protein TREAZ_2461 [Leadbettera azotonutricia ZAS-9]
MFTIQNGIENFKYTSRSGNSRFTLATNQAFKIHILVL